jgi:hypothetical protein
MLSFCSGADGINVSSTNPLPVAIISGGGGGSSGGLTNTELRASAVPVSGTFYQATQPVSIAAPVAVTGTFWQATQPGGTVAVSGSVAVTGAFYQATQPVSIASMPSTPVTGTFWQATQPVSAGQSVSVSLLWHGHLLPSSRSRLLRCRALPSPGRSGKRRSPSRERDGQCWHGHVRCVRHILASHSAGQHRVHAVNAGNGDVLAGDTSLCPAR